MHHRHVSCLMLMRLAVCSLMYNAGFLCCDVNNPTSSTGPAKSLERRGPTYMATNSNCPVSTGVLATKDSTIKVVVRIF
ncbi:hypothetical protein F5B19DRAFT_433858 [Rostrohypoxylon terebratum]|nr:hypothetical protein F5B19DRAFT_433858 [Rostrohypoxylon terebratum]